MEINRMSTLLPHQAENFHLCKEMVETSFTISFVLTALQ